MGRAEFAPPSVETVRDFVLATYTSAEYPNVFVASDSQQALDVLKGLELRGFRVWHTRCERSLSERSLHGHYERELTGNLRKGVEVLVDAMLLSRCDHLVRSPSGVSLWALLWNPTLTFVDVGKMHYQYTWEHFLYDTDRDKTPVTTSFCIHSKVPEVVAHFLNKDNNGPFVWIGPTEPSETQLCVLREPKRVYVHSARTPDARRERMVVGARAESSIQSTGQIRYHGDTGGVEFTYRAQL